MGLFDFLYSDHERVASFLSQLNGIGALKTNEQLSSQSKNTAKKGTAKFGVGQVGIENDREWSKEIRQQFDPLWTNSKSLIDHVTGIQTDKPPELGSLVVLSGNLLAYDLSSLTAMLQSDAMTSFIAAGTDDDAIAQNRSKKAAEQIKQNQADVVRHFLKGLPLGIGFILFTQAGQFWFSVKKQYLTLYDLDIPLKFPTQISGKWNVLGVVDAFPDDHFKEISNNFSDNSDYILPAMPLHMLQLIGATVGLFGRPVTAFGLSPLSIYREVKL